MTANATDEPLQRRRCAKEINVKRFAFAFLFLLLSRPLVAQLSDGDAHFARRAEGARGAQAQAAPIDAAIAAYRRAVAAEPGSLEARWKLLRAIRFRSAYVLTNNEQRKSALAEAKKISDGSLAIVERFVARRGVKSLTKSTEKAIADAARSLPHSGETFFWDSVVWGEWALAYGKMAAAREGAADRILRSSTLARLIDPAVEQGGGARILGRLHEQTPRIPFVTGWASDELAVKYLRESLAHDPKNKLTKLFLAEALASSSRGEALRLLREIITSPNDPAFAVEDAAAQRDARALLVKLGAE